MKRVKIVSGGQTGVDRAALDSALELGLGCGGWCPKGRKAEDGAIPARYPLRETPSEEYAQRTEWNVRDSDCTLVLSWGPPEGGTKLTIELARKLGKPFLVLDMTVPAQDVLKWIQAREARVLNVAGPRESFRPGGVYAEARAVLTTVFQKLV